MIKVKCKLELEDISNDRKSVFFRRLVVFTIMRLAVSGARIL